MFDLMDCLVPSKTRRGVPAKLYQSLMSVPKDLMASLQQLANDESKVWGSIPAPVIFECLIRYYNGRDHESL